MNSILIEKLKDWGYILTIPVIAGILIYLYTQYKELHIKEVQLLKQKIENLQSEKNAKNYSTAYSELNSQKKLYEERIVRISNTLKESKNESKNLKNKNKIIENKNKIIENQDKLVKNKDKIIENKDKIISLLKLLVPQIKDTKKLQEEE